MCINVLIISVSKSQLRLRTNLYKSDYLENIPILKTKALSKISVAPTFVSIEYNKEQQIKTLLTPLLHHYLLKK